MVWVNNGTPQLDKHSAYQEILGVCIALPILTTAIVSLRTFTRARILKVVGIDDYIIIATWACAVIYSGLCIGQSKWGLGLDLKLRPKANLNEYSVINFAGRPFYMMGILGFKVALCFAYLRIMKTSSHRIYKAVTWTVMVTCIIGHLAGTLVLIFQCNPVRRSWRPLTPGTCLPNDVTFYALAAVTIVFDIIIFCLPIPLLLRLNIGMRKKLALVCVFLLGLLTTVCSILRMVQIITIAKTGNSTMLVLWGVIELNIGIILTCIPTLGPLFPYFRGTSADRYTPSKQRSYQLSNLGNSSRHGTVNRSHHASHVPSVLTKGGDRTIIAGMDVLHETGSSDDMVGLKDHMAHTTTHTQDSSGSGGSGGVPGARGPVGNGTALGEGVMKTTDIRVSVDDEDDPEKGAVQSGGRHFPRNIARAW